MRRTDRITDSGHGRVAAADNGGRNTSRTAG